MTSCAGSTEIIVVGRGLAVRADRGDAEVSVDVGVAGVRERHLAGRGLAVVVRELQRSEVDRREVGLDLLIDRGRDVEAPAALLERAQVEILRAGHQPGP